MGVNTKNVGLALTIGTVLFRPCFAGNVTLESRAWPAPTSCQDCITLQFGVLEMRLPTAQIEKIFISGVEPFAVHLLPKGAIDGRSGALFMSATRAAYIGKYEALGLTASMATNSEEFFDLLGHADASGPLAKIRRIENIDDATRYIKASNGKIHAYWLQAAPHKSQYIHFVIDGNDTIYSLVGSISPRLYDAVLRNLRVFPEP
jgi:hypothetical protein